MEIILTVFSWIITILFPLLILSMPVDFLLSRFVKNWKGSRAQDLYQKNQLAGVGIFVLCLIFVIVTMTGTF